MGHSPTFLFTSSLLVFLSLSLFFSFTHTKGVEKRRGGPIYDTYKNISDLIIDFSLSNSNISKLEYLCDTFGPRYCGTPNLENAIDWILDQMTAEGLENVRGEKVTGIINWVRGTESLWMTSPRVHQLGVLGLGSSVGTPPGGITADVLVVASFDDLKAKADLARGKIIVFNVPFVTYGTTVAYRSRGASEAAKVGGVAALVRSVTPYSLYTLHTGMMDYEDGVPQVPTASVTMEDAEMMARMQARGQRVTLTLQMSAKTDPSNPVSSRNVIAEIVGRDLPNQYVVIGGHVDSWDVGQGAMDDGGGLFSAWDGLTILKILIDKGAIPRPRRTIRVVGWVNEEMGARGATSYFNDHQSEIKDHVLAIESDAGNFRPNCFGFTCLNSNRSLELILQVSQLLSGIGAETILPDQGDTTDNYVLIQAGVAGMSLFSEGFNVTHTGRERRGKRKLLENENNKPQPPPSSPPSSPSDSASPKGEVFNNQQYYFNFHHSQADTITSLDANGLKLSVATMAVYAYVVADMEPRLNEDCHP